MSVLQMLSKNFHHLLSIARKLLLTRITRKLLPPPPPLRYYQEMTKIPLYHRGGFSSIFASKTRELLGTPGIIRELPVAPLYY